MSHENTAWLARPGTPALRATQRPADARKLPTWLTNGLLMLAFAVLFALACASAWLSYHAQVAYVLAHNGNQPAEAKVWALLLDTGTAGVSLLRLCEALRRRTGAATRLSLFGCISASVTMNLLHTPSRTPGGLLVAAVPPVMYAVFLEHLLTNLRSLLVDDQKQSGPWRAATLWINFPALMWSRRRELLRRAAEGLPSGVERVAGRHEVDGAPRTADNTSDVVEQKRSGGATMRGAEGVVRRPRRGRGPGPKRVAFETALADKLRSGDLRLFSEDERERNAAAYEAAASLPAPLSAGAVRRYVVQALPRLKEIGATELLTEIEAAPTACQ